MILFHIFTSLISITSHSLSICIYTEVSTGFPPVYWAIWSLPLWNCYRKGHQVFHYSCPNVTATFQSSHLPSHPLWFCSLSPFLNTSPHSLLVATFSAVFFWLAGCYFPLSFPTPSLQSLILKPVFLILYSSHGFNKLNILVTSKSKFPDQISFLNIENGHFHLPACHFFLNIS